MISNYKFKEKVLKKFLIDNLQNYESVLLSSVCILDNCKKTSGEELLYLDVKYLRGKSEGHFKHEGIEVNTGDLVILVDGENSGEVFEIPCHGYMGSTFKKLKIADNVLDKYIMYFITLNKELLKGNKTGAAIPHLNKKLFSCLELFVPPLEEQEKIVKTIDELFRLIDKKEKNDKFKSKLKEVLKEKILDSAIRGTLIDNDISLEPIDVLDETNKIPFEIPSNWKWTTFNNIFEVKGGKRIPKGETFSDSGTHVYIRIADMENMTISLFNLKYIDERVRSMISNYIITSDDLYITVAGTIGQVGSVPKELDGMNLTENANRLIPKRVNKEFYKYILNGKFMQEAIRNNTTKAAQPKLAIKRINDLIIPVPPLEEQKRIVEKIESLFELIEQL